MLHIFTNDIFLNILLAMGLGMILGLERFVAHKTAGMRTYTLIAMGSALFVTISQIVAAQFAGTANFDPLRIAAQVVAAAGFLGVGAIFHNKEHVSGITTASGLWVAAGIGMAAGFGLRELALVTTILALFTFIVLWFIESFIRKIPIRTNKVLDEDVLS
jgi:putative Mg2+ transporter-C (MgtC) family protein